MLSKPTSFEPMADTIKNKPHRKYSCEQVYERMENGLCLFCEELDSPDHFQSKHKRSHIFLIECDVDPVSDDKELVPVDLDQAEDQATNVVEEKSTPPLGKNIKHLEGKHSDQVYSEFRAHIDFSLPQEYQEDSVMSIKSSNDVKLPFSHEEYSRFRKSTLSFSEMVLPISIRDCTIKKSFTCLSRDDRIWEPGGFASTPDLWNMRENRNHDEMLELTLQLYGKDLQRNTSKYMMNVSPHLYRLAVRSDGAVETWLRTYGWEYKKCMTLFVNQGSKVEELSLLKVLQGSEMYGSCREFEWLFKYGDNETMEETKTTREYYKSIIETGQIKTTERVWEPGELVCIQDQWDWLNEGRGIIMQIVNAELKIQVFSDFDLEAWPWLGIYGNEYKKHMLLLVNQANHVWECGGLLDTHVYWKLFEKLYKRDGVLHTRCMLFCFIIDGRMSFERLQSYCLLDFISDRHKLLIVYEYQERHIFLCDKVIKCYSMFEMSFVEFIGLKACEKDWIEALMQAESSSDEFKLVLANMKFHLKHKWRNKDCNWCALVKVEFSTVNNGMCKGLICDEEKKNLRNVEADGKKGKISFLGDGKIIVALAMEECAVSKADAYVITRRYELLFYFCESKGKESHAVYEALQILQELYPHVKHCSSLIFGTRDEAGFEIMVLYKVTESINNLNLELRFIYGSLLRPPDIHSEDRFWTQHNDLQKLNAKLQSSSASQSQSELYFCEFKNQEL